MSALKIIAAWLVLFFLSYFIITLIRDTPEVWIGDVTGKCIAIVIDHRGPQPCPAVLPKRYTTTTVSEESL